MLSHTSASLTCSRLAILYQLATHGDTQSLAYVQANAVADKLLDLRECKLSGSDLSSKTLSGEGTTHRVKPALLGPTFTEGQLPYILYLALQ